MPQSSAFFRDGEATDIEYIRTRSDANRYHARELIESLWPIYQIYADPHFLEEARHNFRQRFWEMYLTCALLQHKFELHRIGCSGPEYYFICNDRRVWVEAIAPGPGEGPDRLYETPDNVAGTVSEPKIILRYTHALREKQRQWKASLAAGRVQANDRLLLAINCSGIPDARFGAEMPFVFKAYFPIGSLIYEVGSTSSKIKSSYHSRREEIIKERGSPVATTSFQNPEFSLFCAVLHSGVDHLGFTRQIGADFLVLHNSLSIPSLPSDLFNWADQYYLNGDELCNVAPSAV